MDYKKSVIMKEIETASMDKYMKCNSPREAMSDFAYNIMKRTPLSHLREHYRNRVDKSLSPDGWVLRVMKELLPLVEAEHIEFEAKKQKLIASRLAARKDFTDVSVIAFGEGLVFDCGLRLESYHRAYSYAAHYLSLSGLDMSDFEGLKFDLSNDNFFERIEDYGIALLPKNGHPIRIPGYGFNSGNYNSDLSLHLINEDDDIIMGDYDISECQNIDWDA